MHLLNAYHSTSLQAGHTFSFASQSAVRITVDFGRVWITACDVQDDFWLDAGQSLVLAQNAHIVVQAEEKFACIVLHALSQSGTASMRLGGFMRLRDFLSNCLPPWSTGTREELKPSHAMLSPANIRTMHGEQIND